MDCVNLENKTPDQKDSSVWYFNLRSSGAKNSLNMCDIIIHVGNKCDNKVDKLTI